MPVLDKLVRHGDVTVIYCRGPIVFGQTNELQNTAQAAINHTGRVIIDLHDVPYVDSTGLGVLAFLCISARKVSGDVKLVAPSPHVADVLETTMLGTVFEVYPTEDAAVAAFVTTASASS